MTSKDKYWEFKMPTGPKGLIDIYDTNGRMVAMCESVLVARRIVAAMNNLQSFPTAQLETVNIITILLGRIIKMKRLLIRHIYMRNNNGDEFCTECLEFKRNNRHNMMRPCAILNAE